MDESQLAASIIDVPVEHELQQGFLSYSLSVIHSRAIPDVRDGLKPVQRRILYGMWRQRLRSDANYRKSARVVGDVMGRYHPHGDSAIYDALVRLGQPFTMQTPLIDPHGNFGSLDDPPAASRYTECRLSPAAERLLAHLDEDTVEFRPNYDGEETEPVYLPAGLPNLLVNGTTGIAVGMATLIPPHNLGEVVAAAKVLLANPHASLEDLLAVLPGPDFPTGGEIIGTAGIADAYRTGRGTLRLRAEVEVSHTGRRPTLTITSLPYQVGPERVLAKIGELVQSGRIDTVADVRDLSDRSGLRLVVDLKAGSNPAVALTQLYKLTPLEETVATNAIVLADGAPQCLGLKDILGHYVTHRLDVVVRRSRYRRDKAAARAHLVEGLLVAMDNIDAVVAAIRSANNTDTARTKLRRTFKLSVAQADYILDMQLRRLTRLEKTKLVDELASLTATIADLDALLANEQAQRDLVASELDEAAHGHAVPRRTTIRTTDPLAGAAAGPVATDESVEITVSSTGLVGRTPADGFRGRLNGDDVLNARIETRTGSELLAVTVDGCASPLPVTAVPTVEGRTRGVSVASLTDVGRTPVVAVLGSPGEGSSLVIVTMGGVLKRLDASAVQGLRSGTSLIRLGDGDQVAGVVVVAPSDDVAIITRRGQLLRTPVDKVRSQGRTASGVAGIRLADGDSVLGVWVLTDDDLVVVATDAHRAKATGGSEYPSKGRGTAGVRCIRLPEDASLTAVWCGSPQALAVVGGDGKAHRVEVAHGRRDGVGTAISTSWMVIGAAR